MLTVMAVVNPYVNIYVDKYRIDWHRMKKKMRRDCTDSLVLFGYEILT